MGALSRFGRACLVASLFSLNPAHAEMATDSGEEPVSNTSVTSGEMSEPPAGRFVERKGEGWYWYQDPKDAPKKKPKPKPEPPKAADKPKPKTEPFSVEWLRTNIPLLLDKAIDNPSKENLEAFYYAQRVMMDKAQVYSEKARQVVAADPFLDENNRVPFSSYSKSMFLNQITDNTDEAIRALAKIGGLWVFFDSRCMHCRSQTHTAKLIADKYGFPVKYISMDGKGLPGTDGFVKDNGTAALLNVTITPTTVFVVPPNNYYVISQGSMARDMIVDRLMIAAESNNLLPKDVMGKANPYAKGVLQQNDLMDGAETDPSVWVKKLKERLKGRY